MNSQPINDETTNRFSSVNTVVASLFFLSGATGLAYQTIWFRRFSALWGSSTLAMAAVVSSFLVGLALGAYVAGLFGRRIKRPLVWYGYLEIAIAVSALLIPLTIIWLDGSSISQWAYQARQPLLLFLVRSLLTFLVIGPTCALMGATLPLLVGFRSGNEDQAGRTTGWLYGINTLGAMTGCCLAGFLLLPAFGLYATNAGVVIANLVIGMAAFWFAFRFRKLNRVEQDAIVSNAAELTDDATATARTPVLIFLAAGMTGCAALILEMVWARQLSLVVGGSTYTFTATLFVVLLGIGLGSLIYYWLAPRFETTSMDSVIWWTILLILASAVAGQWLIPELCVFSGSTQVMRHSLANNALICGFAALVIELLPAVGMGVLFPMLVHSARRSSTSSSRIVGTLYWWNTIGSVLGSVLAFSLLVPWIGVSGAISVAIGLYGVAALVILADQHQLGTGVAVATLGMCGLFCVSVFRSESPMRTNAGMYLYGPIVSKNIANELIYFGEGASCNVMVSQAGGTTSLRVNGKVDASDTGDQMMQLGCAYLPRFLKPEAESVCVIGLGSGATAGASLLFPGTHVTCCEIEPEVFEGARYFAHINHQPWKSPHFEIIYDDARSYLRYTPKKFDLIISEPSNPWIAGVSNLFTKEFYETTRQRLHDDGVLVQWVQTYSFTISEFALIVRTIRSVYPNVGLVRLGEGDTVLLASRSPIHGDAETLGRAQQLVDSSPGISGDLNEYFQTSDVRSLLIRHFVIDDDGLDQIVADDPSSIINSDLNMRLEFDAPKQLFRNIDQGRRVSGQLPDVYRVEWLTACIERWQCSSPDQSEALMDMLDFYLINRSSEDAKRLTEICLEFDRGNPYFQMVARLNGELALEADPVKSASTAREIVLRAQQLGVNLWRQKRYQEATVVYETLASEFPESASTWTNLAINREFLGETEKARSAHRRAMSLDPVNEFVQREFSRFFTNNPDPAPTAFLPGH